MNTSNIFKAIADIASFGIAREKQQYMDFLSFYRNLVETVDPAIAKLFGEVKVLVYEGGEKKTFGILLSVADFLFWQRRITDGSVRFVETIERVEYRMIEHLAKKAETFNMEADQRKKLLSLLIDQVTE